MRIVVGNGNGDVIVIVIVVVIEDAIEDAIESDRREGEMRGANEKKKEMCNACEKRNVKEDKEKRKKKRKEEKKEEKVPATRGTFLDEFHRQVLPLLPVDLRAGGGGDEHCGSSTAGQRAKEVVHNRQPYSNRQEEQTTKREK